MRNSGGLEALCLCLMFYELLGLVNEQDSEQDVTRVYIIILLLIMSLIKIVLCCLSIV